MYKRLRIIVPAVQVTALLCVVVLTKVIARESVNLFYVLPVRQLIANLNYPLVVVSEAFIWIDKLSLSAHMSWRPEGALLVATIVITGLTVVLCIALFWYFVIAEIEARQLGGSLVRFSSRIIEFAKVVVFFLCGVGTFFHAYTETMRPSHYGLSNHGLWPVEIILSLVFLVVWGGAFIGISILDFRKLQKG